MKHSIIFALGVVSVSNFRCRSEWFKSDRYISKQEHEINNILRSLGLPGFGDFSSEFPDNPPIDGPSISSQIPAPSEGLREQFFKPGYEKASDKLYEKIRRVKSGNLHAILRGDSTKVTPYQKQSSTNLFYGKSKTMSTFTHPDVSIETQEYVRHITANEEVTSCRIFGDKQYCVMKKPDRDETEEILEELINIYEKE
nr:unnamed protein product [Callosobruchus chinensis]